MKSAALECVLVLTALAVLDETALARSYLNCLTKKVVIVDAPRGTTTSSTEENFGFWIDEATKIVTLADGKKLNVRRRLDDERWHRDDDNRGRAMHTCACSGAVG
jgi:hypothetical protein